MNLSGRRCFSACVLAVLGLAAVTGCGSSSTGQSVASVQAMTHPQIVQNRNSKYPDAWYEPNPIRIRVGQAITWTNQDADPHDVTADTGVFASGPIANGGTFRWTPTKSGTYTYFCTLHPEMHGMIIVQ